MTKPSLKFAILAITSAFVFTACDKEPMEPVVPTSINVYASSNTASQINILAVTDPDNITSKTAMIGSEDADGIYYDDKMDQLIQLSRTNSQVEVYNMVADWEDGAMATPAFMSTADFSNGREIAVNDDYVIVADDVSDANALYVYRRTASELTLDKKFEVDINLWGIHLEGNTLYAIQDNSDTLAVYMNIFDQSGGKLDPDKKVQIEGIIRTHGITYDPATDLMILTDVGDAADATDGAISFISDFSAKLSATSNNGSISADQQMWIKGDNTNLGNPVDVAWDTDNQVLYVAERKNSMILAFVMPTMANSNPSPIYMSDFNGVSAVYIK